MAKKSNKPQRLITYQLVLRAVRSLNRSKGVSFSDIEKYLQNNYDVNSNFISIQVRAIVTQLLTDRLLVEVQSSRRFKPKTVEEKDEPSTSPVRQKCAKSKKTLNILGRLKKNSKKKEDKEALLKANSDEKKAKKKK